MRSTELTIPARPAAEPTDRSKPPPIITTEIPAAIIPNTAKLLKIPFIFCIVKKFSLLRENRSSITIYIPIKVGVGVLKKLMTGEYFFATFSIYPPKFFRLFKLKLNILYSFFCHRLPYLIG